MQAMLYPIGALEFWPRIKAILDLESEHKIAKPAKLLNGNLTDRILNAGPFDFQRQEICRTLNEVAAANNG